MASDAMEIDDFQIYNPTNMPPQRAPVPPPVAGQKRSRSEFEGIPPTRSCVNPLRVPGTIPEPHTAPPVPARRVLNSIIDGVRYVSDITLGWAGRRIRRSAASARAYIAARPPIQHAAVLEPINKRRKTGMPGSYPISPVKDDAAVASPIASTIPPKFVGCNQAAPGEDSPFTKITKLRPVNSAASLLNNLIQAMPVALPTASMPQQTAENGLTTATSPQKTAWNGLYTTRLHKTAGNGPTPPDSRPTSSHSNEDGNTDPLDTTTAQAPTVKPETERKRNKVPPPTRESIRGKRNKVPAPTRESIQPRQTRASYRQPFYPLQVSPNAEPSKSILKHKTRDAEIESLITKAKTVVIESPEEKAVRFTYRRRKQEETLRNEYALRQAREAMEEEIEREREEEERAFREAEERKQLELRRAEEEKERLRKAEEERKVAEALAEKQRVKDEAKKKAAAEAEERRIAHEAKLAAKSARLAEEYGDEDEDLVGMLQLISTLSVEWTEKIHREMSVKNMQHTVATSVDGTELSRRDFGSLLPQEGTSDDPSGWLNDEMVNGMLATIVATKKARDKHRKGRDIPIFEAYSSAWYTTYKSGGIRKLARWSKRKGIEGKKLLKCHRIFFPINTGNHWMLLIISPMFGTIEFLDSLQNSAIRPQFFAIAREWLQMELGAAYKASEWTDVNGDDSISNRQGNMNDCGVFTCFNALASAKYMPFSLVDAKRMPEARRLMAAILMKGKLEEEFKL